MLSKRIKIIIKCSDWKIYVGKRLNIKLKKLVMSIYKLIISKILK